MTAASVVGFAALAVVAALLEVRARTGRGGATGASVVAATMRDTGGRVVVLAAWLWVGVHFLAR